MNATQTATNETYAGDPQPQEQAAYEIYADTGAGEHSEGRRGDIKAAFALARRRWREYKGQARVTVRWCGDVIANDPSDFYLSRKRHRVDEVRRVPERRKSQVIEP